MNECDSFGLSPEAAAAHNFKGQIASLSCLDSLGHADLYLVACDVSDLAAFGNLAEKASEC
jgi:hypothetical protein